MSLQEYAGEEESNPISSKDQTIKQTFERTELKSLIAAKEMKCFVKTINEACILGSISV